MREEGRKGKGKGGSEGGRGREEGREGGRRTEGLYGLVGGGDGVRGEVRGGSEG